MDEIFIRQDYGEDEFGCLHDLGITLSEGLLNDFGESTPLSLAKDLVDELLCIDIDSPNPPNLDRIPDSDYMNTIQSELKSEGLGIDSCECEVVTDEETNNMLLLVTDDAESVGSFASDCHDIQPNNDGHRTYLTQIPKGRSKLRHIVPKKTTKVYIYCNV